MRAAVLRRRISIRIRVSTQDSAGQQISTWTELLANVPAEIVATQGRELRTGGAINAEVSYTINVRYHPKLADPVSMAGAQIVYVNGSVTRYFNVTAVIIEERNRSIQFMAEEGLNQGG